MKLSIVMPVYNEAPTVRRIIERVLAADVGCEKELIVVDDASTDGTREVLASMPREGEAQVRLFFQEKNRGKGAAVGRGLAETTGDAVVVQDADLEYDPSELLRLAEVMSSGRADGVYGSRYRRGNSCQDSWFHYLANKFLTLVSNMATGLNLTDMETCYKMLSRGVLGGLEVESRRFGIEPELTGKLARMGSRVREVAISYNPRRHAEGKKISWKDGVSAIHTILKFRSRLR